MATTLPFRGLRYNTPQALDLALVTAPPYDVISPEEQDDLYQTHPYNIVRLILGKDEPNDDDHENRYTRAARHLKEWVDKDILVREQHPAFYLYEQEFTAGGHTHVRRGFIARVALEEFGEGSIYPHEQTFAGPKADRLKLLKATRTNLSQVMALHPDPRNEVAAVFDRLPLASPDLHVVDHEGVINRAWVVTDEAGAAEVTELMSSRPLFIADGHHRYSTALEYRRWLRSQGEQVGSHHPANFTSMMCISMSDPGLVILPNHRVLWNLPEINAEELEKVLAKHFNWTTFSGAEAVSGRMEDHLSNCENAALGIYLRGDQNGYVAELKDPAIMTRIVPDHSEAWRTLDVSVLHRLVLDRLLTSALGDLDDLKIDYMQRSGDAFDAVHEDGAAAAILVRPATMDQVQAIAAGGELMPQKATHFYPKILSGIVANPLD